MGTYSKYVYLTIHNIVDFYTVRSQTDDLSIYLCEGLLMGKVEGIYLIFCETLRKFSNNSDFMVFCLFLLVQGHQLKISIQCMTSKISASPTRYKQKDLYGNKYSTLLWVSHY